MCVSSMFQEELFNENVRGYDESSIVAKRKDKLVMFKGLARGWPSREGFYTTCIQHWKLGQLLACLHFKLHSSLELDASSRVRLWVEIIKVATGILCYWTIRLTTMKLNSLLTPVEGNLLIFTKLVINLHSLNKSICN